ncbi:MAG TPA: hypothetical protein PLU22_14855 [Polyangiaceae bacterium]|nr:hypothetical protein [Polyangiaceae bacterium]
MASRSWVWVGVILGAACAARRAPPEAPGGGQRYDEAIRLICTVDDRLEPGLRDDPLARSRARWDRIREEVTNPDGIYLRTILEAKPPGERRTLLAAEAAGAGLADCPLATAFAAEDEQ